jgi:hypothetical protein
LDECSFNSRLLRQYCNSLWNHEDSLSQQSPTFQAHSCCDCSRIAISAQGIKLSCVEGLHLVHTNCIPFVFLPRWFSEILRCGVYSILLWLILKCNKRAACMLGRSSFMLCMGCETALSTSSTFLLLHFMVYQHHWGWTSDEYARSGRCCCAHNGVFYVLLKAS